MTRFIETLHRPLEQSATCLLLAGLTCLWFSSHAPILAADKFELAPGGNGGAPFEVSCGESAVLVGIKGRAGQMIDQVQGLCVKIDPISGSWIGGIYQTPAFGGGGGVPFMMQCPIGTVVVNISGHTTYSPTFIAQLSITCTYLSVPQHASDHLVTTGPLMADIPAAGMRPADSKLGFSRPCYVPDYHIQRVRRQDNNFDLHLHEGGMATGLLGRSGTLVDAIDIVCGFISRPLKDYRVDLAILPSPSLLHGTVAQAQWKVTGVSPELTPPLEFSWQLDQYPELDISNVQSAVRKTIPLPNGRRLTVWTGGTNTDPFPVGGSPCPEQDTVGCFGSPARADLGELRPGRYRLTVALRPKSTEWRPAFQEHDTHFEIRENRPVSVTIQPNPASGGMKVTGTVALEGPGPRSGKVIHLSSSSPELVGVPPSIVIAGGAITGTFVASINPQVSEPVSVTVRASDRSPLMEIASRQSRDSAISTRSIEPPQTRPPSTGPAVTAQDGQSAETASGSDSSGSVMERGITGMAQRQPRIQSPPAPPSGSAAPVITVPNVAPGPGVAGRLGQFALERPGIAGILYVPPEVVLNLVPANPLLQRPDTQVPNLGGRVPRIP
jgi:hypothetical protein